MNSVTGKSISPNKNIISDHDKLLVNALKQNGHIKHCCLI